MTPKELEAEVLKLPEMQRAALAKKLLASLGEADSEDVEDPIFGLGKNPVECGVPDGSVEHDRYLYGSPPL